MTQSPPARLQKIDPSLLRNQVLAALQAMIVRGDLRPGDAVIETALAEQLGVSRAPVREAVMTLQAEGLIEGTPFRGKRVTALPPRTIEEIYSLREVFELFAIDRVLAMGADLAPLDQAVTAMQDAAHRGDFVALGQADERFHRTLIQMADHALLLALWDRLALRIGQIISLRNRANADLHSIVANHTPILQALRAGDAGRARDVMSAHVRSAADLNLQNGGQP